MKSRRVSRLLVTVLTIAGSFGSTPLHGDEPVAVTAEKIVEDHVGGKLVGRYTVAKDGAGVEVRHGPFETFFSNGKTATKGSYLRGELHGAYEKRGGDGRILESGNYDRGARTGLWRLSLPTGAMDRQRSGTYAIEEEKDVKGRVVARGSVFNGKRVETWTVFYPDGRVAARMEVMPDDTCRRPQVLLWNGIQDDALLDFAVATEKSKAAITIDWAAIPEFAPRTATDPSEWVKVRDAVKALGAKDESASRRAAYARKRIDLALLDGVNTLLQVLRAAPSGQEDSAQRTQREKLSPVAYGLEYEFASARSPFAKMTSEEAFLKWYALCALAQFDTYRDELILSLALAGFPRTGSSSDVTNPKVAESVEIVLTKGWSQVQTGPFVRTIPKDPALSKAISRAVDWLIRHQAPEGRFPASDFLDQCSVNRCSGQGVEHYDIICTALAIQAILGDPRNASSISIERATALLNGLFWLLAQQDPEGAFESLSPDRRTIYVDLAVRGTSLATGALAESSVFFRSARIRAAAERGVRGLMRGHNPYKAWGDEIPPVHTNFVDSTGYAIEAIHAARAAGIDVPNEPLGEAARWLDEMTDENSWRTGYWKKGGYAPRDSGMEERWPGSKTEWLTAVAMTSRFLLGQQLESSPALRGGADLLQKRTPSWSEAEGTIDFLYWLAGTRAMSGVRGKGWERWQEHLREAALRSQRRDGDEEGSWDPQYDPWGHRGGRFYSTAVLALALETMTRPNFPVDSIKKR